MSIRTSFVLMHCMEHPVKQVAAEQVPLTELSAVINDLDDAELVKCRSQETMPSDSMSRKTDSCASFVVTQSNIHDNNHWKESMSTVEGIIEIMKGHQEDAQIQLNCCGALANFCFNVNGPSKIVELGGIELIIMSMKSFLDHAEIQRWACAALSSLGISIPVVVHRIAALSGIELVVSALTKHFNVVDVQRMGCMALWTLVEHDTCSFVSDVIVVAKLVVEAMIKFVDNADVQGYGCGALQALTAMCNNGEAVKLTKLGVV